MSGNPKYFGTRLCERDRLWMREKLPTPIRGIDLVDARFDELRQILADHYGTRPVTDMPGILMAEGIWGTPDPLGINDWRWLEEAARGDS